MEGQIPKLRVKKFKNWSLMLQPKPEKLRNHRPHNSKHWFSRFILQLTISQKIGYGYALAIGIAVLGTSVGLFIGDYYQKQANTELRLVREQQNLLTDLEKAVVAVRSHPQKLLPTLGKSILFQYESSKFLAEVVQFETQVNELQAFIDDHPQDLAVDVEEYQILLKGYNTNINHYTQLIKALWQQLDIANLTTEEIPAARQQILVATSNETAIKIDFQFERLTEQLGRIIAASETQEEKANATFSHAETLRLHVIIVSMLLSSAIAVLLALITSRAIARPLEAVTQVAQQVTKNANFDLRSPVTTEDEVGVLATSLNQLILWAGEYTQELELSRQMLEQRVEERTQELKEALQELQRTHTQLIQSEKMSSLGQLVAGVAHEINNPVNFISGNLNYARGYTQDLLELIHIYQQAYPHPIPEVQDKMEEIDLEFLLEDLPKILSSMKLGAERIQQIVLSLRNFSRLDEAEMKDVDLHEGIENTLLILNHRLKQGIEVIKNYGDLPLINCYPAQLNQVFMNILSNAIDALYSDAIGDNKLITITTQKISSQEIKVSIRDNGSGISPEHQSRLFDPFFTTKPVGKGTGLGLSISYQIIEKHQGKIEVNSTLEQGTEFLIYLPIH